MLKTRTKRECERGFGIIAALVAATIGGIIMISMGHLMKHFQVNTGRTKARAFGENIFHNLVRQSSSPLTLQKTQSLSAETSAFVKCLKINGGADCVNGSSNEFALFDATGIQVTGTSAAPIRYSVEGGICKEASSQCPFEAITAFSALCGNSAVQCDQAAQINISVTLQQALSVQQASAISTSSSNGFHLASRNFVSTVNVDTILNGGAQSCGLNQVMTGISATGKIICTDSAPPLKRDVFVAFSPISHQWWSSQTSQLWANDINYDCTFWNSSNETQHLTVTTHWTGTKMPLLNGLSPANSPTPTTVNITLASMQAYVWNSSYCTGKYFAGVYCANSTYSTGQGVPKGLAIQVQEARGTITASCTIYNQSGGGMTSFNVPVNGGNGF